MRQYLIIFDIYFLYLQYLYIYIYVQILSYFLELWNFAGKKKYRGKIFILSAGSLDVNKGFCPGRNSSFVGEECYLPESLTTVGKALVDN